MIQMSRLLYLVACRIDGARAPDAIAALVSDDLGRSLSASQVSYVITDKLAPLGVLAGGAAKAALPTASPLLALRARATLLPAAAANGAGALFRPLFHFAPVIAAVIAGGGVMDYWLFVLHGLSGAYRQVLGDPAGLLLVAALSLISAAFHECGHAAGCRYGGARPGRIGGASTWSGPRSSRTSRTPTGSAGPAACAPTWAASCSTASSRAASRTRDPARLGEVEQPELAPEPAVVARARQLEALEVLLELGLR